VNFVTNNQLARISGGIIDAEGGVLVDAASDTVLVSVAFGGAAAGTVGLAGAITVNTIAGQTLADVTGGADIDGGEDITVQAKDNNRVVVVALGAAGAGTVAGGVSASTTQLDNAILSRVENADLDADGDVTVQAGLADDDERGEFDLASAGVDVDLASYGTSDDSDDAEEGEEGDAGLAARDTDDLDMSAGVINISFAGAGGGTAAGAGAVGLNWLRNSVRAEVSSGSKLTAGNDIDVLANDKSTLLNFSFGIAGGGTVAGGAAISFNYIGGDPSNPSRSLQSEEDDTDTSQDLFMVETEEEDQVDFTIGEVAAVVDGSTLEADKAVTVDAQAKSMLINFTAGGAAGGTVALSGSIGINFIKHQVNAEISGGADVKSHGVDDDGIGIQVTAGLAPISINVAGAASGAGTVGLAGASATTDYNSSIKAQVLGDDTTLTALDGHIVVDALLRRSTEGAYDGLESDDIEQADVDNTDEDADVPEDDKGAEKTPGDAGNDDFDTSDAPDVPSPTAEGDQIFTAAISGAASGVASVAGALSLNWMRSTAEAEVEGAELEASQGDVRIGAEDNLGMNAFTVAAGASAVFSAAGYMSYNYIGGNPGSSGHDATNRVTARVEKGASIIAETIGVEASSDSSISAYTVGASVSKYASVVGSTTLNFTRKDVNAQVNDSFLKAQKGDIDIHAEDTSSIISASAQISIAVFGGSVGVTVALNDIANTIEASSIDSQLIADKGSVIIDADSSSINLNVVAGASYGTFFSGTGDAATALINNEVKAFAEGSRGPAAKEAAKEAAVKDGPDIQADEHVVIHADSNDRNFVVTGTVSVGLVAAGAAVGVDLMGTQTSAWAGDHDGDGIGGGIRIHAAGNGSYNFIDGWDDGYTTEAAAGVAVMATSRARFSNYTSAVGGGGIGVAANLTTDGVSGSTRALIGDADISSDGDVILRALHVGEGDSGGGSVAVGALSALAAVDTSLLSHTTSASVLGSGTNDDPDIDAVGDFEVKAESDVTIITTVTGVSAGLKGVGGSASAIDISLSTNTLIQSAIIEAENINIQAANTTDLCFIVGTGVGGGVAAGASLAVGLLNPVTTTDVLGSQLTASGDISINADQHTTTRITAATGSVGAAAVAGTISVMTSSAEASAYVGNFVNENENEDVTASRLDAEGDVDVTALTRTEMNPWDNPGKNFIGSVAAGIAGAGASVDVMVLRETSHATVGDNTSVTAGGDINVEADIERDITSYVMAFALSGAGFSGSVSVVSLGKGLRESSREEFQDVGEVLEGSFGNSSDYKMSNDVDPNEVDDDDEELDNPNAGTQDTRDSSNEALMDMEVAPTTPEGQEGQKIGDAAATVGSDVSLVSDGNVNIDADDDLITDIVTGAGSVSLVASVGLSISILDNTTAATATAGSNSIISGDDVSVTSDYTGTVNQGAYGGTASLGVSAAGQNATLFDNTHQLSYLENGVAVSDTESLAVTAHADRNYLLKVEGGAIGKIAAGVSIGVVELNGGTEAYLGDDVQVGDEESHVDHVSIDATSVDEIDLSVTAIAAGIAAGSGNLSQVDLNNEVHAWMGAGGNVDAGNVNINANATPKITSETLGVDAGGVTVGVSETDVNMNTDIIARLVKPGNNAAGLSLAVDTLDINAELKRPDGGADNVRAKATGATGSLAGGNSTLIQVDDLTSVAAEIGGGAYVSAIGAVSVAARQQTRVDMESNSYAGGLAAVGAAINRFTQNTSTNTLVGEEAEVISGSDINLVATTDQASFLDSVMSAEDDLRLLADQTIDTDGRMRATSGGLIAGTGGAGDYQINLTTHAGVGHGASIDTSELDIDAAGRVIKNEVTSSGDNNNRGEVGGVVAGGGSSVDIGLDLDTQGYISDDALVDVHDSSGSGDLDIHAFNELDVRDQTDLVSGGLGAGGGITTDIDATDLVANVSVGDGADLDIAGDTRLAGNTEANLNAVMYMDTYGAVTVGVARANVDITPENSIDVDGADITGQGEIWLLAGRNSFFERDQYRLAATIDTFAGSAIPVDDVDSTINMSRHNRIDIGAGADMRGGADINLHADDFDQTPMEARAKAVNWVSAAIGAIDSALGGGSGLEYTGGSADSEAIGTVNVEGDLETGINRNQSLVTTLAGGVDLDDLEDKAILEDLIVAEEGLDDIDFNLSTGSANSGLFSELDDAEDQLDKYKGIGSEDLIAYYETEVDRIKATLLDEKLAEEANGSIVATNVDVLQIDLEDIDAIAGRIDVRSDQLGGDGHMYAPSDVEVAVINKVPAELIVNDINVPNSNGGLYVNGSLATDNATVEDIAPASDITGPKFDDLINPE
ncbi:MAG: hypothetical protein LC687_05495, partial [Actinobacteria bacterium]|nr:hypothetical protein [Actinomycetota bacterium]